MNRDLCGVKLISGLYCRLSAPGRSPAALKGQKAPQFKILPSKCPWTISSGTQRAESSTIQDIAAEVPLDDLQRHSKGRKPHNSRYCRRSAPWTISSGTQRAESPTIQDIAVEVPLDCLQRHSSGTKQTSSSMSTSF